MSHSHSALAVLVVVVGCGGSVPPVAPAPLPTPCPVTSAVPALAAGSVASIASELVPPAPSALTRGVTISLKNPLGVARAATISVPFADALQVLPSLQVAKAVVQGPGGSAVLSQLVDTNADGKPDEVVFQAELGPNESKSFMLGEGERRNPTREQYKVYGRFVRERHDDFAWENDRTAHRMYGPELETFKADPLTSSGIDVWVKRTARLVVNEWYQTDDYHHDNGDGADFYSVGPSRGCGGVGIWDGKALHNSRNFVSSRVLANGPIRLIFELGYAPWDVGGGLKVAETKRIVVDAGQHFDRFESSFKIIGKARPLTLGIGIAKHPGGVFESEPANAVLRSWEPFTGDNGHLGCAVISASAPAGFAETATDRLLLAPLASSGPTVYLAGTGWDKGGGAIPDNTAWIAAATEASNLLRAPVVVSLTASPRSP